MATTNKIMVGVDDQIIELTGEAKAEFIAQRNKDNTEYEQKKLLLEAEYKAKQDARESALTKLATIAGLNEEEMKALGL
jgi:hypothetical protein